MGRDLRLERFYRHPREQVWEAITDGDTLARWLSATDFAAEVGHAFTLRATPGPGFDGMVLCRVLEVEAPHTLAFSWSGGPVETVVTLRLHADGRGTRLEMVQSGFQTSASIAILPLIKLWWDGTLQSGLGVGATTAGVGAVSAGAFGSVSAAGSAIAGGLILVSFVGLFTMRTSAASPEPAGLAPPITPTATAPDAPLNADESAAPPSRPPGQPIGPDAEPETVKVLGYIDDDAVDEPADPLPFEGARTVDGAKPVGTLNYYDDALPTSLDPLFARTMVDVRVDALIFDRLFYGAEGKMRSRLITAYTLDEDGQGISVEPLAGIRWHDGKPFTADDICFTVDALLDPLVPTTRTAYREILASCKASEGAAAIRLQRAVPDPRAELDFAVLPAHAFDGKPAPDDRFATRPIGTGPMKAKQGRTSVKFEAFPNAHHNPKIAELNLYEGGDPLVQVRTLQNGGADGIISVPYALVRELDPATGRSLSYDTNTWWYAALNTHHGPLRDARLREAVELSIGREQLRHETLGLGGRLVSGPPLADGAVLRSTADLQGVNSVMRAAGAVRAATWEIGGEPVTLQLGIRPELADQAMGLLTMTKNQLQEAGFAVQVFRVESSSREELAKVAESVDVWLDSWTGARPEQLGDAVLHTGGSANLLGYADRETDRLLDALRTEGPWDAGLQQKLEARLNAERPVVFLWNRDSVSAWSLRVKDQKIAPYTYFTDFDQWRLEGR